MAKKDKTASDPFLELMEFLGPAGAPATPAKTKRPYRLGPAGLAMRRAALARNKPWLKSTGPKTFLGKKISSQNNLKHGMYTLEMFAERKKWRATLEMVRKATAAKRKRK
jgi:hypothetical protein